MAQTSSSWLDRYGFFGRTPAGVAAQPSGLAGEGLPTAANSTGAWSTGWDVSPGDSLVGGAFGFAEQRLQLADQIGVDLMFRPDLREAPEEIQRFLLRVWPLVIAHAQLTDEKLSEDACSYLRLVDDVLWSVRLDATLHQPAQLFHLIPGMLEGLRRGLALLGDSMAPAQAFFADLERMHRPALKLCNVRRREAHPTAATMSAAPFDSASVLGALRPGVWIDLYSGQAWVRARLHWVDPHERQFLFKSGHGGLHTMTRRILERLVREQLLRLA